jgi:hypothetical protein
MGIFTALFDGYIVAGNERHLLGKGGRDKQAVKRVAVYSRQAFKGGKKSNFYRNNCKAVGFSKLYKTCDLSGKGKFSLSDFSCKFPSGNHAQVYVTGSVKYGAPGSLRQRIIAVEKPDSSVCVQ